MEDEPLRSLNHYMQRVRWPAADVDLFIYGIPDQHARNEKLQTILGSLRRSILVAEGVQHDVVFVKTPNTVTVVGPNPRRKIQIITRNYQHKADVLNAFDLDCCRVGFDGQNVLATQRAIPSIRSRVNTIDLNLRGDCYENRLLKYAERGFR